MSRSAEIPCDYNGEMCVLIMFFSTNTVRSNLRLSLPMSSG
ncbi:MAG: hypothetical protein OXG60_20365 [Chloroflexi bacterium]|nr:hypothetical protein [Chloroflexota bacterium]